MIDATTPANGTGGSNVALGESETRRVGFLDQDQFLTLLVEQLKHQDPLAPMESQEFAAQMAQFASLESLNSIDDKMGYNLDATMLSTRAINNTMAASLIGKEVTAAGDLVLLQNGSANIHMTLMQDAKEMEIIIFDENGTAVQTIRSADLIAGDQKIVWDGSSYEGISAPDAVYTYSVSATDGDGDAVDVLQTASGIITGVSYEGGNATLMVGDLMFPMGDVRSIRLPEE